MADVAHLTARFLHVGAALLWIGYLAFLAWAVIPAARHGGAHGANVGPIVERIRPFTFLGPLVLAFGLWLVTASGHAYGELLQPGWGHAITGGIVLSIAMMGLEHGLVVPRLRDAHTGPTEERDDHLAKASTGAQVAAVLGLLATFLMVLALLGGL
jgi:uncharacterized membrane protein